MKEVLARNTKVLGIIGREYNAVVRMGRLRQNQETEVQERRLAGLEGQRYDSALIMSFIGMDQRSFLTCRACGDI